MVWTTTARGGEAPFLRHGPCRAPKLGPGVLNAMLHAARKVRAPGPAPSHRRGGPCGRVRGRRASYFWCAPVKSSGAPPRTPDGRFSALFGHYERCPARLTPGARAHAASVVLKIHLPGGATHGMPSRGATSSRQNLIFHIVLTNRKKRGLHPRAAPPVAPQHSTAPSGRVSAWRAYNRRQNCSRGCAPPPR